MGNVKQVFPKQVHDFSPDFCRQRHFRLNFSYLHDQPSSLYAQNLKDESFIYMYLFEIFPFVGTDNTNHGKKFKIPFAALCFSKHFA